MNALLKWEHDWIDANRDRYDPPCQADRVKMRIEYRYWENERKPEFRKLVMRTYPELVEKQIESLVNAMLDDVGRIMRINTSLIGVFIATVLRIGDERRARHLVNAIEKHCIDNKDYLLHLFGLTRKEV